MKTRINQFLLLLVAVFVMTACERDDQGTFTSATPVSTVKSRVMSFESKEALSAFIEEGRATMEIMEFRRYVKSMAGENFVPLMPALDENDPVAAEAFRRKQYEDYKRMMTSIASRRYVGGPQMRVIEEELIEPIIEPYEEFEVDVDYDYMISDPYFVSMLSEDREIIVAEDIYRYTEYGVAYTSVDNYDQLEPTLTKLEPCDMYISDEPQLIDQEVYLIKPIDYCDGGSGGGTCTTCGGGSTGGSTGGTTTMPDRSYIRDNLKVCEYRPNILNTLFGPSEKCIDHFASDRRVKVKSWAQNYVIFASTGIKVKSQRRRFRIWWAKKIDELELGYSMAYFEYNLPTIKYPTTPSITYEYQDWVIDQYGNFVSFQSTPRDLFQNFPVSDPNKKLITIYLPESIEKLTGTSTLDLSGKDVNSKIRSLVKEGFKKVSSTLNKQFNNNTAVIVSPNNDYTKLRFMYTNWEKIKTNENKISEVFDWSTAQIGVKINGGSTSPTYGSPQIPRNAQIIGYGMGRSGTTWKGGRVVMTD